jgi:hypothetical protein
MLAPVLERAEEIPDRLNAEQQARQLAPRQAELDPEHDLELATRQTRRPRNPPRPPGRPAARATTTPRNDGHGRVPSSETVKIHRVEEEQPDGSWAIEHDERPEHPAKHRPN